KPPRLAPNGDVNQLFTLDDPCTSAEGGWLTPVATFAAQLRSLKRSPDQQIIVATITGPSMPYTVHWRSPDVTDSGPWPEISHSSMGPDGAFADPAVRIGQFADTFGANSEGVDACASSWGPSLHLLADRLPPLPDAP